MMQCHCSTVLPAGAQRLLCYARAGTCSSGRPLCRTCVRHAPCMLYLVTSVLMTVGIDKGRGSVDAELHKHSLSLAQSVFEHSSCCALCVKYLSRHLCVRHRTSTPVALK
jgi:hypothetical protein